MKKFEEMKRWLAEEESGQGMVEYGLIIVLVALAVVATLTTLGTKLSDTFKGITTELGTSST